MRDHTNCNHCYCIKEGDPNSTSASTVHVSCCKCGDRIAVSKISSQVRFSIQGETVIIGNGGIEEAARSLSELIDQRVEWARQFFLKLTKSKT